MAQSDRLCLSSDSISEVLLLESQLPGDLHERQKSDSTPGGSAVSLPSCLWQNPKATTSHCHKCHLSKKTTLPCETGSPLRGCEKGVTLSGLLVTVYGGCHLSRRPAQAADLVSDQ